MLRSLTNWIRWKLRINWVYTGTTIEHAPDGYKHAVDHWLNVNTNEEKQHFLGEIYD